jgi:hypothetical protein
VAGLAKLTGELPLRRRVDGAAVLVEEKVEQRIDVAGTIAGGDEVATPKRSDLSHLVVNELSSGALRLEPAFRAATAVVAVPASLEPSASLDRPASRRARHVRLLQRNGPGARRLRRRLRGRAHLSKCSTGCVP